MNCKSGRISRNYVFYIVYRQDGKERSVRPGRFTSTALGNFYMHSFIFLREVCASSNASSLQSSIWCFLFQFPVSSGFVQVIQQLFTPSSSSSHHFYPPFYRTFSNVFWKAVLTQGITNPVSLPSFLPSFMRTCTFCFLQKTLHGTLKHPNTQRYEMYHTAVKAVCSMAR